MSEYIIQIIQKGILETLEMTFCASLLSYIIGLPLGRGLTSWLFKICIEDKFDIDTYIRLITYILGAAGTFLVSYAVSSFLGSKAAGSVANQIAKTDSEVKIDSDTNINTNTLNHTNTNVNTATNNTIDNTTKNGKIANTGNITYIAPAIAVIAIFGIIVVIKYREYKDI